MRKNSIFFHAIITLILLCSPVYGIITEDPCGCDPILLQRADDGDANVQNYVAFLYATGKEGVQQDYARARYWYQRVIDHQSADAKLVGHANLRMALMYNGGKGVPKNYTKALECYKKAAAQGYYEAHLSIGLFYANGLGVKQDYNKAIQWLKVAAANRQPQAQHLINLLKKEMNSSTAGIQTNTTFKNKS